MYTQEAKKRITLSLTCLTALRHILHELANESDVDTLSEEPNIFEQLTFFIDTRLNNIQLPPSILTHPNALSAVHLAFIASILEKKISIPHEAYHVVQQTHANCKSKIKHTVEKLYGTIRSCPPELLHALKVA